jgi:pimeloyl-ACP methyl ester carboxylesterase
MGTKDLPPTIDHITKLTGFDKISYVGHSQGTTQLLAGGALDPEYFNSKINIAVLLAPPMSIHNCGEPSLVSASQPFTMKVIIALAE